MPNPYLRKPWLPHYRVSHLLPLPTRTLLDEMEIQADINPQAISIQYFDRSISYAEMDHLASRFAALLASYGVGRGDRVALSLQNNPQFAIVQYGAWKRGAAVVPLSPMYKEEELEYQINDAGAKVWVGLESLYSGAVRRVLPRTGVQHVSAGLKRSQLGRFAGPREPLGTAGNTLLPTTLTKQRRRGVWHQASGEKPRHHRIADPPAPSTGAGTDKGSLCLRSILTDSMTRYSLSALFTFPAMQ